MLTVDQALDLLRRCCFRIRIEQTVENGKETWWFGTGFFVSRQGHALTAYHGLPEAVRTGNVTTVDVFYKGREEPLKLEFCPELSHEDADIAVLQLTDSATVGLVEPLPMAYLPLDLEPTQRKNAWRRTAPLYVFGYPVRCSERTGEMHTSLPDYLIEGTVAAQVSAEVAEFDPTGDRSVLIERVVIEADPRQMLDGISGGPVLDGSIGAVVAVEGSYDANSGTVYASDLARMLQKWRRAGAAGLLDPMCERGVERSSTPAILGKARADLGGAVQNQVTNDLAKVFPAAEQVIVIDTFQGYTADPDNTVVLGVEVQGDEGYDAHLVKLGRRNSLLKDYDGFRQCLQDRPFASRVLVPVTQHDLGIDGPNSERTAIIYQNAYSFYTGADQIQPLQGTVEESIATGTPDPASVERVIAQMYADFCQSLYCRAEADRSAAVAFYKKQLKGERSRNWEAWNVEDWRVLLRRDLIWLFNGRDAPDNADHAAYLDAYDYVDWTIRERERLPETLVGPSLGGLNEDSILVRIARREAEYPAVWDYGRMDPANAVVWDFVSLETELKVRLLSVLHEDPMARQSLRPGRDSDDSNYLDPDRCPIDLGDHVLPAGQLAFAFWFEQKLAALTDTIASGRQRSNERLARGPIRDDEKLSRILRILLQIRREAAMWLGRQRSRSSGPQSWKDEYYFALAAYALHAAPAYDELQAAFALVSGGVAVARMNLARALIRKAIAAKGETPGPYPAYQVPLFRGYDLWRTGTDDAHQKALKIFESACEDCRHAVPFRREYALLLAASGEHRRARDLVEPLRLLAREFGDHETLCRIARTHREEGNKAWDRDPVTVDRIQSHPGSEWYRTSFALYREAFEFSGNYYPGVCTAQLAATLGETEESQEYARQVLEACESLIVDNMPPGEQFWVLDSKGSATLILKETMRAVALYQHALERLPVAMGQFANISYHGICRLHWALGDEVVGPVAELFWNSSFSSYLQPGPMDDCGRRPVREPS